MKLLEPLKIGKFEVKNRIIMPPMCIYKAKQNGKVKLFHKVHYSARALGGVGMIIVEATAVEPRGRISDFDLGLWNDEQIDGHSDIVKDCHKFGSIIGVQLAHAGRKSKCEQSDPVSASQTRFSSDYKEALELSIDEIEKIINKFVNSGKRAIQAGYDFVEIHAAHGYLINEFLSPLTNLRDDEFGGDFFSRSKILFEIAKGLKDEGIPFGVRLSASEWEEKGINLEDTKLLSSWLEKLGAIYIHISAGGNHEKPSKSPKFIPMYQCEYAKEIKKVVDIPVIAVGLINRPSEAEALLLGEVCDLVAFGRELLRNPNLAFFAMSEFDEKDLIEKAYERAF